MSLTWAWVDPTDDLKSLARVMEADAECLMEENAKRGSIDMRLVEVTLSCDVYGCPDTYYGFYLPGEREKRRDEPDEREVADERGFVYYPETARHDQPVVVCREHEVIHLEKYPEDTPRVIQPKSARSPVRQLYTLAELGLRPDDEGAPTLEPLDSGQVS